MTGYKESDQSSEDNWKPNGESVKEQKEVEKKKKRGRPTKEVMENECTDEWKPKQKHKKKTESCNKDDREDDWRPNENKKNKSGRPKKIKSDEDGLENKKSKKAVSDEEEDCSDYADSKQEIGSKEFKFQKEDKIFDKTVNTEVLVNEVNMNPMLTLSQIEAKEVPIFHYSCEHCDETFQHIIKFSKHMHSAHVDRILTFNGRTKHIQKEHKEAYKASITKENIGKSKLAYACSHCKELIPLVTRSRTPLTGGLPPGCNKEALAEHILKHELGEEGIR